MIIDSDSYAASGIDTLFFPGGEPHVKLPAVNGAFEHDPRGRYSQLEAAIADRGMRSPLRR
jgi:hypothetical protein